MTITAQIKKRKSQKRYLTYLLVYAGLHREEKKKILLVEGRTKKEMQNKEREPTLSFCSLTVLSFFYVQDMLIQALVIPCSYQRLSNGRMRPMDGWIQFEQLLKGFRVFYLCYDMRTCQLPHCMLSHAYVVKILSMSYFLHCR